MPARAGKRDSAGEAGRTCTDDRHGLGRFALGDNSALKRAHLYPHRSNTQTPAVNRAVAACSGRSKESRRGSSGDIAVFLSDGGLADMITPARSEEHTSELQSLMRISYAV